MREGFQQGLAAAVQQQQSDCSEHQPLLHEQRQEADELVVVCDAAKARAGFQQLMRRSRRSLRKLAKVFSTGRAVVAVC